MGHWLVLILVGFSAWGDLQNPNVIPLGDMEALLGNAGVAIENSTGGVFYNPAGLGAIEGQRLNASGSTYSIIELSSGENNEFSFKEFVTAPNMIVSSRKYGTWTGALSILAPTALEMNSFFNVYNAGLASDILVTVHQKSEENYFGYSLARKISKREAFGVSAFLYRSLEQEMSSFSGQNPAGTTYVMAAKQSEIEIYAGFFDFGYQIEAWDGVRLGLKLRTESYQFSGKAEIYDDQLFVVGGTPTRAASREKFEANAKLPWELTGGFHWRLTPEQFWTLDATLNAPTSVHTVPNTRYNDVIRTRTVMRVNTGYGVHVHKRLQVTAAVSWNPSTYDSVQTDEADDRSNFLGGHLGIYHDKNNVTTGVGLYYLRSRADKNFFGSAPDNSNEIKVYGLVLTSGINF